MRTFKKERLKHANSSGESTGVWRPLLDVLSQSGLKRNSLASEADDQLSGLCFCIAQQMSTNQTCYFHAQEASQCFHKCSRSHWMKETDAHLPHHRLEVLLVDPHTSITKTTKPRPVCMELMQYLSTAYGSFSESKARPLDLSSNGWNVTAAAQSDAATVRTPPPPRPCISDTSAACVWAPLVLNLLINMTTFLHNV